MKFRLLFEVTLSPEKILATNFSWIGHDSGRLEGSSSLLRTGKHRQMGIYQITWGLFNY
jgi:hypothetical protein